MADLNFTTSANNIIAQVVQPEIVADANNPNIVASVSTGNIEVTSTQVVQSGIIGDVSNPNIVASVSTGNIEVTSAIGKEKELSVNTINLGEENIPDPILYYRKNDIASIILSQLYFIIAKKLQDNENLSIQDTIVKLLNTRIEELTDIIDQVRLNFSTVFQDLVDATDDFYGLANIDDDQIASIQKVLIDYLNGITDSLYKSIGKKIELTLVSTDTSKKLLSKISNDSFISLDIITKITEKSLIETKTILEQSTKLLEKVTSDIVIKQDLVNLLINLNKLDTVQTISNFFSIVTFIREFSDQLDATDDFYGLANIDDDQIASFQKVLVDQILLVEQFITQANFLRSFSDTINGITEIINKNIQLRYNDEIIKSDLDTKLFTKILVDKAINLEQFTFATEKYFENLTAIDDNQIVNLQKLLINQVNITLDTFISNINKVLINQLSLSEETIINVNKILSDQTQSILDQAIKLLQKLFNDSLNSVSEVNTKLYNKNNLDEINTSQLASKIIEKSSQDLLTTIDSYKLLAVEKSLLDQTQLQEIVYFLKITTIFFYDQLDATDDFYGLANIDDDQLASLGKVLASSTSGATDFSIRHIMPNKVDSVATSELRSAHIQDYFLEEYVEHTQRYVGTILTI